MLRFDVYRDGGLVPAVDLSGAYLFGQESVPVRAEINASNGQIICAKRARRLRAGVAVGRFAGRSVRAADHPAAGAQEALQPQPGAGPRRMMLIARKREDWGLLDYPSAESLGTEFDDVRKVFIEALKANFDRPAEAARLADECLAKGVDLGERMAMFHARAFLSRRRKTNNFGLSTLGCVVDLLSHSEGYRARLAEGFDFIRLPVPWKHLEPKERDIQFQPLDAWIDWCRPAPPAHPRRAAGELRCRPRAGVAVHLGARLRDPARHGLRIRPAGGQPLRQAGTDLDRRLRRARQQQLQPEL